MLLAEYTTVESRLVDRFNDAVLMCLLTMPLYFGLILATICSHANAVTFINIIAQSLLLPPAIRLALGGDQTLRKECEARSGNWGSTAIWSRDAVEGYQVATTLFQKLAEGRECSTLWFPHFSDQDMLEGLVHAVNENTCRLGGVTAKALKWPRNPCNAIQLKWSESPSNVCLMMEASTELIDEVAVSATKAWVDDTLCRLRLCPYTQSLSRAAVGLESANVNVGPIVVKPPLQHAGPAAAVMAAAFWEGVTEIATIPEEIVASSLLIAPYTYDHSFDEFATVCDELIEVTVQVVHADRIVGRAWFHPKYCAARVGHETIVAGHALPATMVHEFIETTTMGGKSSADCPSLESVALANDAVRWTPHATINLLRRSQLTAAKQVEAMSSNKKPNHVYVRNVMKILADQRHSQS